MFKRDTYTERRRKLREAVGEGIILICGNDESPMSYADNCYPFIQDSTFLYFYGIDRAGLFGVIDLDNNREYIFGTDFTIDDTVWMGPLSFLSEEAKKCGIQETGEISDLTALLAEAKAQRRRVHYTSQYRHLNIINLSKWLNLGVDEVNENISEELTYAVANLRNVKTQEEIAELERATNVTREMHLAAMRYAKPGMKEHEVAAKVAEAAKKFNATHSFFTICTRNGQTLHNHNHSNTLQEGDLLLLDCGARLDNGYCGDMTSTMPVSGKFTEKQADIYSLLMEMYDSAESVLRAGITFKEVHLKVCRTLAAGMVERGLMVGDIDEIVASGAHALFMPHGLGHMIGMDVHDMENFGEKIVGYNGEEKSTQFGLKSLRLGRELEVGFAFTVEPGIYFIPELIAKWKKDGTNAEFLNFERIEEYLDFGGMRHEGDYIITEEGYRRLGNRMPKYIDEIEEVRREAFTN